MIRISRLIPRSALAADERDFRDERAPPAFVPRSIRLRGQRLFTSLHNGPIASGKPMQQDRPGGATPDYFVRSLIFRIAPLCAAASGMAAFG
jgi:hypothetical protein